MRLRRLRIPDVARGLATVVGLCLLSAGCSVVDMRYQSPGLLPSRTPTACSPHKSDPRVTVEPHWEGQVYRGTGDSVVELERVVGPAIARITGNAGAHSFCVENYGLDDTMIGLLVNTDAPYEGYRPLDWRAGDATAELRIRAIGEWEIEIVPVGSTPKALEHTVEVPGSSEGDGDRVIVFSGETPHAARIVGNEPGQSLRVVEYSTDGVHVLVNTTECYDDMVFLHSKSLGLEVVASASWSIEITDCPLCLYDP